MAGTGLGSSVLGIRAGAEGFGTAATGFVMSGYYAGFFLGSLTIPVLIQRVGHIRVFAGMASLASAALLLHAVALNPAAWWILRLVTGLCIAGLFIVSETWLNGAATNRNRGQLLAWYTVVVTGGLALGQLLLNVASPLGFGAFVLTSVLVSFAVVPVALVSEDAPALPEPVPLSVRDVASAAPLGAFGAVASGFTAAAVVGFGAVYAARIGLSVAETSILLFAALLGAVVLQFAIGTVADRYDRRLLIAVGTAGAGVAALMATLVSEVFPLLVLTTAFAGGMAFPLYSLANAHLNDHLSGPVMVAAGARMVLLNGAGAVVGPLAAAVVVSIMGPDGFFFALAAAFWITTTFALYRLTRRAPVAPEDRTSFHALPSGTGTFMAALVPEAESELYPETEGDVFDWTIRLRWRERGNGPPVVLVHDAGSSSRAWEETMLELADAGYRAIAYDLRGHGASGQARFYDLAHHLTDLDAVLRERDVPAASLVGLGAGAALAVGYAARHPERVNGLVLVSADQVFRVPEGPSVRGGLDRVVDTARAVLPARAAASLEASESFSRQRSPGLHRRLATDLRLAGRKAVSETRAAGRLVVTTRMLERVEAPMLWVSTSRLRERAADPIVGERVVVEDAGYFIPLDQPGAFVDAIVPFLRDASVTGAVHVARGPAEGPGSLRSTRSTT